MDDKSYGWMPFVRDKHLKALMEGYNAALTKVAAETLTDVIGEVLQIELFLEDFADNGHFSRSGNRKFAEVVAHHIKSHPITEMNASNGHGRLFCAPSG